MNEFRSKKAGKKVLVVSLLTVIVFTAGCAILTPTQVREVNKFATAAHSYGPLPGAVIEAHSDIRQTQKVLEASTFKNGENSLNQLKSAIAAENEFRKRSRNADQALDILTDYADLLVNLTSDEYTNEIQASAENLGEALDKGISKYNKENDTSFSLFGSTTAAIVRGAGGLYIKHKQAKALKNAITKADPAIDNMITAVEKLLVLYLNEDDLKELKIEKIGNKEPVTFDLIRNAREDLEALYKNTVTMYEGKLPYGTFPGGHEKAKP
jgi:type I site-specific restriction endonuclease